MNQLHQGDNLAILRNMPGGSVDLICTDPPFNTGRDWGDFDDRWGSLNEYLKFMEVRAVEMRRVLKDTGSLYLHCDPTASHYLKVMLDGVFGIKQFRNEIVWKRQGGRANNVKSKFSIEHDYILFYNKANNYIFNPIYFPLTKKRIKRYNKTDENGRKYEDKSIDKRTGRKRRVYLDTNKGIAVNSLWTNGDFTLNSVSKERLGYPTQKPVALYERMIKASSNQGDTVLDPFAGSGTTLDAAHTLGRQWIGIDEGDEAINVIQGRLRDRHGLEHDRDYELITE